MGRYRISDACQDNNLRYVGLVIIILIEQQATLDLDYDMTYMYNPFVTTDSRRSQAHKMNHNRQCTAQHHTTPHSTFQRHRQQVKIIYYISAPNPSPAQTHGYHAALLAVVLINVIFFAFFFLPVGGGFSAGAALLSPFSDAACTCAINSFSASSSFSQS